MGLKHERGQDDALRARERPGGGPLFARITRWSVVFVVLFSTTGLLGCADRAWEAALRADEPSGYYRYMRDHAGSNHVADAQERLDFHKVKRNPSLQSFAEFVAKHPNSPLTDQLRPQLEPHAFVAARAAGTPAAYSEFLAQFPEGELAERARGNAAYAEADGFGGRPTELAGFAAEHPLSDFAGEAKKSSESVGLVNRSRFDRVALSIQISASTPEAKKLQRRFVEIAQDAYARAGIELVPVPDVKGPAASNRLPSAILTIAHSEHEVSTSIDGKALTRPGHVAQTQVTLRPVAAEPAIFDREFTLRIDSSEHVPGTSVLSSTASPRYWAAFFVPVVTSQTNLLLRPDHPLIPKAVDVDAARDRSVVLFEDGRLQLIELADPGKPVVLGEYVRPNDLKKWSGVRILGNRVAIFGEEGIEFIEFNQGTPHVVKAMNRSEIGTVFAVEPIGDQILIAGARGLMSMDPATGNVTTLIRRVIHGLALVDQTIVFTDVESVFVSDLALLQQNRVHAQQKLGRAFGPRIVRSLGQRAVVIGATGIVAIDLTRPQNPTLTAKLMARDIGRVDDATSIGGRTFLVGERGLLLMDPGATRIIDSVDVEGKTRLATMGRHLVTVGERSLQVVDATPTVVTALPAAPPPDATR
jgi:hypothetical protein